MHVQQQIDELLALRASEWLELAPTATQAERNAFASWLGESRLHVQAFLEVAELECALHRIDSERVADVELILSRFQPKVVQLAQPQMRARAVSNEHPFLKSRVLQGSALLVACLCAVVVAFLFLTTRTSQFSTAVGEQKTIELTDTSVITLNALSKIEVHMEHVAREIELSRGEALFTVAHDPSRPFRVHTRAGIVQAVGTQFNVYDRPNGDTRVSVLEGRVQLTALGKAHAGAHTSDSGAQILTAGEEADIRLDGSIARRTGADVANTVAWRRRRLVFDNAGLAEMFSEFNRYNPALHLRLEGAASSAFRFTGIFDAADPESFVGLLEKEPDLILERRGDEVVVRPRASKID